MIEGVGQTEADSESHITETTDDTKVEIPSQHTLASPSLLEQEEESKSMRAPLQQIEQKPFYLQTQTRETDINTQAVQNRLDSLLLQFRTDMMNEFVETKTAVLKEQTDTVNEEKAKCTSALDVKQNEIERLTTAL